MIQIFFKYSRWLISVSCLIAGIFFMELAADLNEIRPVGMVIVCFAMVFWMSRSTYESANKTVFVVSMIALVATWLLTRYVLQYYTADALGIGFFMTWEFAIFVLGSPPILYLLWKDQ